MKPLPYLPGDNSDPEPLTEINTTPLIDVMLVLFIMLIVTISPETHTVTVDTPAAPSATETRRPIQLIEVDDEGHILWDGQTLRGPQELESRLRAIAADPAHQELRLRPAWHAPYRNVSAVLAASQRLGVKRLSLVATGKSLK